VIKDIEIKYNSYKETTVVEDGGEEEKKI